LVEVLLDEVWDLLGLALLNVEVKAERVLGIFKSCSCWQTPAFLSVGSQRK
jgi:hypothetical protein